MLKATSSVSSCLFFEDFVHGPKLFGTSIAVVTNSSSSSSSSVVLIALVIELFVSSSSSPGPDQVRKLGRGSGAANAPGGV